MHTLSMLLEFNLISLHFCVLYYYVGYVRVIREMIKLFDFKTTLMLNRVKQN